MMGARIQRKKIQAEFLKNKTKQRNVVPDFLYNVLRIKQRVHLMVRLCVCARVCSARRALLAVTLPRRLLLGSFKSRVVN